MAIVANKKVSFSDLFGVSADEMTTRNIRYEYPSEEKTIKVTECFENGEPIKIVEL